MHTIEVRPWRLIFLFSSVLVLAAYLPHPNLVESLPQSISTWLQQTADS
ncbi:MAG: hypothetical protein AAF892_09130 [Cyanobacteria bacterium P01_D01_bin.71]